MWPMPCSSRPIPVTSDQLVHSPTLRWVPFKPQQRRSLVRFNSARLKRRQGGTRCACDLLKCQEHLAEMGFIGRKEALIGWGEKKVNKNQIETVYNHLEFMQLGNIIIGLREFSAAKELWVGAMTLMATNLIRKLLYCYWNEIVELVVACLSRYQTAVLFNMMIVEMCTRCCCAFQPAIFSSFSIVMTI